MLLQSVSTRSQDERIIMEWSDVKFSMFEKDPKNSHPLNPAYKEKLILKGISGEAETGQLLAIMGPTGCGKTSLVNILSARVSNGNSQFANLRGTIKVNGEIRDEEKFRRFSAYVLQDDMLYAHLSVRETLLYAAHFFLSSTVSTADKEQVVKDVIQELGLVKVTDTLIGDDKKRGISGGERKRTAIGAQLISDPAVLFLDEPTSGLDSFQALSVMECMKGLADHGRLVISVIHQPRSSIFNMFDRLILLSEGHLVFAGTAESAVDYFRSVGYSCPNDFNPADYFLDVLSPDNRTEELDKASSSRILELAQKWREHQSDTERMTKIQKTYPTEKVQFVGESEFSFQRNLTIFFLLCNRTWMESSRNWGVLIFKTVFGVVFALLLGGIYSSSSNDQKSIQNRIGLLFFVLINQAFNGVLGVLNTFPKEKIIVNRFRSLCSDPY